MNRYQKILVALDGGPESKRALEEAIRVARLSQAHVRGLYVLDRAPAFPYTLHYDRALMEQNFLREGRAVLDEAARTLADAGLTWDTTLIETDGMTEDVPACLLRCAEHYGADLVVMGTHGRHGVKRAVLGSMAERFLRISTCPVLLMRGEAVEAPATQPQVQTPAASQP